jgi:hypothetical protein
MPEGGVGDDEESFPVWCIGHPFLGVIPDMCYRESILRKREG